jgi:Na+/pantothenate symporter
VSGALGVGVAIWAGSIVKSLSLFYSVLSAGLFVPVVAGLLLPRVGRTHALTAMVTGVAVTALMHVATRGAGAWQLAPVVWGLAASGASLLLALALVRPRA